MVEVSRHVWFKPICKLLENSARVGASPTIRTIPSWWNLVDTWVLDAHLKF